MTGSDVESTGSSPATQRVLGNQRAVRDIRLVMILNLATIPLSLATNLLLGRTAAEVLGWYGAVQIFIAAFNTFLIIGGLPVFSRLVPPMREDERVPFLLTYGAMVLGLLTAVTLVASLVPGAGRVGLGPFGGPSWFMAYAVCVAVLVMAFATHFLYAVEKAPQAVGALKSVIVGYFVVGLAGTTLGRSLLMKDPAGFMWWSTLIIYVVAALLGVVFVLRTPEVARAARWRAYLPRGFWPVVLYTHVGTIVEFSFSQLYPAMVLLWLDVVALSRLHAALRFVSLLALAPVMLTSVLAPSLARLESSGRREEALQQAGAALRACLIVVAPGVFALVVFAPFAMSFFGADFRPYGNVLRLMAPMALAGPLVYLGGGMAVAFGAFRSYLLVSSVFVVTSVFLAWVAIPRWGLIGAAAAGTLGSFVQQAAMSGVVRRKLGFRAPFRVSAAWIVAVAIGVVSAMTDPGFAMGLLLWVTGMAAFAWLGSVTPREIRVLASRASGAA
jgi:O-antigen/teichoic acid export membrane protein